MVGAFFTSTGMNTLSAWAMDTAENKMKSMLSKRYTMSDSTFQTSTSIPPILTDICQQWASGLIKLHGAWGGEDDLKAGRALIKDSEDCVMRIAAGKDDLLNTAGGAITVKTDHKYRALSNTESYHSTFDEDSPLNWQIDVDKKDDIGDGRL